MAEWQDLASKGDVLFTSVDYGQTWTIPRTSGGTNIFSFVFSATKRDIVHSMDRQKPIREWATGPASQEF